MDRFDASGDLSAEFAFLHGMLSTSGGWTRSALAVAACDSPWFAAEVATLAPPPAPSPALALAAGVVVSLPLFGPLAANAGEWGDVLVRNVLGHKSVDGDVFDFRDGEAVWADTGKSVSRSHIRAMDRGTRQEFYSSMGLATPTGPVAEASTLAAAPAQPAYEPIRVYRDGREAPVLAAVRDRVAAVRAQRRAEYLALVGPAPDNVPPAGTDTNAIAIATSGNGAAAQDGVIPPVTQPPAPRTVTLYDQVWAQVARERAEARARGDALPASLAQSPARPGSLYEQIWAEVKAERAAARGDGVVGTMADVPAEPDLVDVPVAPDLADVPASPALADVPPDRDLIDASAAFIEPRG